MVASKDFSYTSEQFFADKPIDLSPRQWLVDTNNPHRFEIWTLNLLDLIGRLSKLRGYCFAAIDTLAGMIGRSGRWVKTIIRRLEMIGMISAQIIRGRKITKRLWLTPLAASLSTSLSTSLGKSQIEATTHTNSVVSSDEQISTKILDKNKPYDKDHQKDDSPLPSKVTPTTDPIVSEFQRVARKPFSPQRDGNALAELQEMAKDVVKAAFNQVRGYMSATATKINSLGYVASTAKNLIKSMGQNASASISDYDCATAYIGSSKPDENNIERPPLQPDHYDPDCPRCFGLYKGLLPREDRWVVCECAGGLIHVAI